MKTIQSILESGEILQFPAVRSPLNYDRDALSVVTGLSCQDKTKAQQNMKEETDINTIVKRFGVTGQLPDNLKAPQYGDFTGVSDYQTALHAVMAAEDSFMKIPASTRARFHNSPQALMEFLANPENREEALRLKLLKEPPKDPMAGATALGQGVPSTQAENESKN